MARVLALIAAIALHALIIIALLFGVRLPKPEPAPQPSMQARLVTPVAPSNPLPSESPHSAPSAAKPAPKPTKPAPEAPKPAPVPPKPAPTPKPKAVPKPLERPRHESPPKPAPEPAKKPAIAKPAKPDERAARQRAIAAELAAKAQAEQAQQEAEQKRADRLRAQMAADELRRQLARESAASAPSPRPAEDVSALLSRYKGEIRDRVRRFWSSDALRPGLSTAVRVRLDPRGNVLTVRTVRSSGNRDFDQAVEAAVMRASPLPIPNRPDLYQEFREIDFTFSAKDFDNA